MLSRRTLVHLLVFTAGAATMGVEMCASRLLAPFFGNSLPVWAVIIGLLLTYLAAGSALGGRIADRKPEPALLFETAAWASASIVIAPVLAPSILRLSVTGFAQYGAGPLLGSFFGAMILFAAPVTLLGSLSPFAIRLSVEQTGACGTAAGSIYATSTAGSLIGTFVTVFTLIPTFGTRRAMLALSLSLLSMAVMGLLQIARRKVLPYLLLLAAILALFFWSHGPIKATEGMIYETESAYNYIQVSREREEIVLRLNEGEGLQSVYQPGRVLTGYVYDYFLLAPLFRSGHDQPAVHSLCVLGLGAGTTARQYSSVYGPIPIDGVEIDPAITRVAEQYFDLVLPNLNIFVEDGRYFLLHHPRRYDVVLVDTYIPPYIPFQFTTEEFFREVRDHLNPDGVLATNVARTETDHALVDAIASTLKSVYPAVFVVETLGNLNSVIVATLQPINLTGLEARFAQLSDPSLSDVAARCSGRIWEFTQPNREPFTDDHAPVEQMVHAMLADYISSLRQQEVP